VHRRPRLTPPRLAPAVVLVVLLAGCTSAVDTEAGPDAADPRCAEVRGNGFDELADRPRRETNAHSTAAWGEPAVVMRCGVEPPGPTTDACVGVDGTDWVLTEPGGRAVFTTYGRVPAIEVTLPDADRSGTDAVLAALGALVARIPQDRECL
jgi:hypothetical protein